MGRMGQTGAASWLQTFNSLLANGEQGIAKLDFSDFTGMYQDRARTIPYTAVEQPLGSFTGLNGVTATAPADVNRGVVSARVNLLTKTEQFDDVAWSKFSISVTADTQLSPRGDTAADTITAAAGTGIVPRIVSVTASAIAGAQNKYSLYVKPGTNNFVQVYKIGDGSVFCNFTLTGAGSATSNGGALGSIVQMAGGWYLITFQYLAAAASQNPAVAIIPNASTGGTAAWSPVGTESVHVWGASLTLATDAHLPYQWVNTPTDYDTAGFPHYLKFNGTNTTYVTPSIDFTGTDKMTVWAGVTKLSATDYQMLAEFGASGITPGSFGLWAHYQSGAYRLDAASAGSLSVVSSAYTSPHAAYITGIAAPADGLSRIRVNGVQYTRTPSVVPGAYGNHPLFIGARAGTSFYFNGRLYSLIVRGAQSSLSQIEATENLIRQKMRLP